MTSILLPLSIAAGSFALMFILGPLLIYWKYRMPNKFEFFPLTDADIEANTAPEFVPRSYAIEALGFERVVNLQSISHEITTYIRVFHNFSTQETATVTEMTHRLDGNDARKMHTRFFEFCTYFLDGLEVNTNNVTKPAVTPRGSKKLRTLMPGVEDAALLYKIHRNVASTVTGEIKPLPAAALVGQELEREVHEEWRRNVEIGYTYLDEERSLFRPTVKGSILMSWRVLWPVGAIRELLLKSNAKRLMADVMKG